MIAQGARFRQVLGTPALARPPDEIQAAFERDDLVSAVVRTLGEPFEVPCEDVAHFVHWLSGVHSPRGRAQRFPALKLRHEKGTSITWRQWYAQCGVATSIRQGCRFYRKRDDAVTILKQLRAKTSLGIRSMYDHIRTTHDSAFIVAHIRTIHDHMYVYIYIYINGIAIV